MTTLTSKRIAPKVYEVKVGDDVYEVDGQPHEHDSREWCVVAVTVDGDREWCTTLPTKRAALEWLGSL